jgi:hypothetical protein
MGWTERRASGSRLLAIIWLLTEWTSLILYKPVQLWLTDGELLLLLLWFPRGVVRKNRPWKRGAQIHTGGCKTGIRAADSHVFGPKDAFG